MTLSETFWVAFVTTMTGFILKLVSMAYKSKCKECSVCCIKVIRDVEIEVEEHEFDRLNPKPPTPQREQSSNNFI